jgi:hypothetical protein
MHDFSLAVVLMAASFLPRIGDLKDSARGTRGPRPESAGSYFWSNGFEGEFLEVHPEGRFDLEWSGCVDRYHLGGGATLIDGHLVLSTDLVHLIAGMSAPRELIPIHWGTRLYLVPKEKGPSFCDFVYLVGSSGYPCGTFYIRAGDEKKEVVGLPGVPEN